MGWAFAAPWMLWGLLGVSIPVIVHLLNRRRTVTVDWGAMQFLDVGRRARRKLQITELLLMAGRMLLLAVVALAVARPLWEPKAARGGAAAALVVGREPRDYVFILDGSESMDRNLGGASPRSLALEWAKRFVATLGPEDSVGVIVAKDRVRPLFEGAQPRPIAGREGPGLGPPEPGVERPARRPGRGVPPPEIGDEFRLGSDRHDRRPEGAVEGRRAVAMGPLARPPGGPEGPGPRLWAIPFGSGRASEGADASVAPLELARGVFPPGGSIAVTTHVANAGPGPTTRSAELLVDGSPVAGAIRSVGPIPPGGKVPLEFRATIADPGSHLLTVRLSGGDDPLAANDQAERPVEVAEALPVLIVDGEPGVEPLSGESDFLRAALAPAEDEAPAVRARVVKPPEFSAESLRNQRVLVLANVDRLDPAQDAAIREFLASGGGVLVAPGDRTDDDFWNRTFFDDGKGWMPAKLGEVKGDFAARKTVAHPSPRTFTGPALGPFSGGDAPPLGEADLFGYRALIPAENPAAATIARLDTGDPWAVERPWRSGRVIVLAGPLDAEGGTLPVNPDFVPLVHELVYRLADPSADARPSRPGEPIRFDLPRPPGAEVNDIAVTLPGGEKSRAAIVRTGGKARVEFADPGEPGIYRFALPGGGAKLAAVAGDDREGNPEPLAEVEARALSEGWPLTISADPGAVEDRLSSSGPAGPRPLWRGLVLAALGGLCLEVWMTRRMVVQRGVVAPPEGDV